MKALYNISIGIAVLLFVVTLVLAGAKLNEQIKIAIGSVSAAAVVACAGESFKGRKSKRNREVSEKRHK